MMAVATRRPRCCASATGRDAAVSPTTLLLTAALLSLLGPTAANTTGGAYDVCVVGAGSSGAFTAVKLKQKGLKVLVLETGDHVGGHCDTQLTPGVGNGWIDPGVQVFTKEQTTLNTFAEWGVQTLPSGFLYDYNGQPITQGIYLSSVGAYLPVPTPSTAEEAAEQQMAFVAAVLAWNQYYKDTWASILDTPNAAMPDFSALPQNVVSQLLGPFGAILWAANASIYDSSGVKLDAAMFAFQSLIVQGPGPLATTPGIYALRNLSPEVLEILLGTGLTLYGGCSAIYSKFQTYLGDDLKLRASYKLARRGPQQATCPPAANGNCYSATVDGTYVDAGGATQKVKGSCKKVVISALPSMANLAEIYEGGTAALDEAEAEVFSQVTHNIFAWAKVQVNSPNGRLQISTFDPPTFPAAVNALLNQLAPSPTAPTTARGVAWSISLTPDDTVAAVKPRIYSALQAWAAAPNGPTFTVPAQLENAFWSSKPVGLHEHTPRPANIANLPQFYSKLYQLQGRRDTFYTGALMSLNTQNAVWKYSQWLVDTYFAN